jgi:hypothetical protein
MLNDSTRLCITVHAERHNALDQAKVVHQGLVIVSSLENLINQGASLFRARERVVSADDLMDCMVHIRPNRVEDALCKPFNAVWLQCYVHCFGGGCCVYHVGSVDSRLVKMVQGLLLPSGLG